jgi:hypothetical protein
MDVPDPALDYYVQEAASRLADNNGESNTVESNRASIEISDEFVAVVAEKLRIILSGPGADDLPIEEVRI